MSNTQNAVSTSSSQGLELLAESTSITPVVVEGKTLFSSEELGKALGFSEPRKAINKLFERNKNELKHYSTDVKLTSVDGSMRNTRAFTREGALIVSMLARTNNAKAVRAWLARLGDTVLAEAERNGYLQGRKDGAMELLNARPLWKKVNQYRKLGLGTTEIARLIQRSVSTVRHYQRQLDECGLLADKPVPVNPNQLSLFDKNGGAA